MKSLQQYQQAPIDLRNELKHFVTNYNGRYKPEIEALADKIEHMVFNIGCPNSIIPMLKSICKNQIKKWSNKWDNKGKQLGVTTLEKIKDQEGTIFGHFRWNFKGYVLDQHTINYIDEFFNVGDTLNQSQSQANDFLTKTSTNVSIQFKEKNKYWMDDKEPRNIYHIVIMRNAKSYSFTFGDSINNTMTNKKPTAYDILATIQKYPVGTYKDFCDEFGYYPESTETRKTYKAVLKEWKNVNNLFEDCLPELQEIN